jgi:DNA adenine methylase
MGPLLPHPQSRFLPLIPEHKTYVEVFAGGAALFFAKERSPIEVINDLDSGLTNLYNVLKDKEKFERFQILVELSPYSRKEYFAYRANWKDCEDDVEQAARYFVVARQCFSGNLKGGWSKDIDGGSRGMSKAVARYLSAVERLPEVHRRLRGVQVEELDFRKIIQEYDRPSTFFYLDPPYVTSTRRAKDVYHHEMTDEDHDDMIELLLGIKGKAMLSGYANPIYGPLECACWKRIDFDWSCTAGVNSVMKSSKDMETARKRLARVETIWLKNWSARN